MTNSCTPGWRRPTTTETLNAVVRQVQADDIRSLQNVKPCFQEQSTGTAPAAQRPVLGAPAWWKTWWSWRLISGLWVLSGSCGLRSQHNRRVSNRHISARSCVLLVAAGAHVLLVLRVQGDVGALGRAPRGATGTASACKTQVMLRARFSGE